VQIWDRSPAWALAASIGRRERCSLHGLAIEARKHDGERRGRGHAETDRITGEPAAPEIARYHDDHPAKATRIANSVRRVSRSRSQIQASSAASSGKAGWNTITLATVVSDSA
jgi:hypothetical protein